MSFQINFVKCTKLRVNFLFFLLWFFLIPSSYAATNNIRLETAPINTHDIDSIKRGAKFFASNCMMCHSLKYLKHDPIATAAGIDYEKMPIQQQSWWLNKPPPDLSLIANSRGPDWLYTFLHSFYQDNSRDSGYNNLLVDNTNMPNLFSALQGTQILIANKNQLFAASQKKLRWFNALELINHGSMTPEEFDSTITDVVSFLVYASEPNRLQREELGWWVLGFLVIFLIFAYLLKREYWNDIKPEKPLDNRKK